MFERFTDRARRVVVLAQEEARRLNHNYIGTEHILLGLVREGEGVAARALESLGVSLERTRAQVEDIIGRGDEPPADHIPFTPRSKKVLELSLREAMQLGHDYIGTEHILLGLVREGEGVAAQILVKSGVDLAAVRQQVVRLVSGYAPGEGLPTAVARVAPAPTPVIGTPPQDRRCSFCLRSEDRVGRIVRSRDAWICDGCIAAAGELVAGAAETDPKRLRFRPRTTGPAEPDAAEAAVEHAFETALGGEAGVTERLALIEDSEGLGPAVERLVAAGKRFGSPDLWVDTVRFISADEAEVHWSVTLPSGGAVAQVGYAVLDHGTWKVGRPTFERLAAMAGVVAPPRPADPGV